METYNVDFILVYNLYNRFIKEIQLSQSSNASLTKSFDKKRLVSYLAAIRHALAFTVSKPEVDAPESNPELIKLRQAPELLEIENESVAQVCRMLAQSRDELISSQSSRYGNSMVSFDFERQKEYLDRIDLFLSQYIEMATPLDLVESSPRAAVTPKGNTGV